jgi:hypothetical protein
MSPAPNPRSSTVIVGSPISQGTPEGGITGMLGPATVAPATPYTPASATPGIVPTLQ